MERNDSKVILMPITTSEVETLPKENIYVLYVTPYDDRHIEIGMLDNYALLEDPNYANLQKLDFAMSKAYFYEGGIKMWENATDLNRPIYKIQPTKNRKVDTYQINSSKYENYISLNDMVHQYDTYMNTMEKTYVKK